MNNFNVTGLIDNFVKCHKIITISKTFLSLIPISDMNPTKPKS